MNGILKDTIAELIDRRMLYVFVAVTAIAVIVVAATSSIDMKIQITGPNGPDSVSPLLAASSAIVKVFGFFMSLLVFLATMASASLIPSMLEKGSADFYLTKPLSRRSFLLQKYGAMWLTYGGIVAACGVVVVLTAALVHGFSEFTIAYLFGASLVNLAIWLSITVMVGVLSRSTPMAIMAAFLVWVAQTVLSGHEAIGNFVNSNVTKYVIDALYYILPKPSALFDQATELCLWQSSNESMPLLSSILFAAAMMVAAVMMLKRKEL